MNIEKEPYYYKTPSKISAIESEKISKDWLRILNGGQDLYIDMIDTSYIASAGLRHILIALKSAGAKGLDFAVLNPNDSVMEIFKVTGLTKIVPIFPIYNKKDSKSRK